MSYLLLASDSLGEGLEKEIVISWTIQNQVYQDYDLRWALTDVVTADYNIRWGIISLVYNAWNIRWSIEISVERAFELAWSIATDVGTKLKYTFWASKVRNRIFRRDRIG